MIALPLVTSPAVADTTTFTADLNGESQAPPTDSRAKGNGDFTYDDTSKKLSWTTTYWGLSGKAKSAHLHGPASEGANADTMITVSPLQSPIEGAAIFGASETCELNFTIGKFGAVEGFGLIVFEKYVSPCSTAVQISG
jgi:hypothetical protein